MHIEVIAKSGEIRLDDFWLAFISRFCRESFKLFDNGVEL